MYWIEQLGQQASPTFASSPYRIRHGPPWDSALDCRKEEEHHVGSEELCSGEYNHRETDWKDETFEHADNARPVAVDSSRDSAYDGLKHATVRQKYPSPNCLKEEDV